MSKRIYSDTDKALALTTLEVNDYNFDATSSQINVPVGTLRDWAKGKFVNKDVLDIQAEKRPELAEEFKNVAYRLLGGMTEEKIKSAKLNEIALSVAICVDKMELLNGNVTSRTENVQSDYQSKLQALREQKAALRKVG